MILFPSLVSSSSSFATFVSLASSLVSAQKMLIFSVAVCLPVCNKVPLGRIVSIYSCLRRNNPQMNCSTLH
ncbi:MAG: hypothetical protein BYD32DRAFT_418131 [Podila humilis]|nr:MAG: hypothetical protein BYD32DRAFT_418131 [Podila humilis]